MCGKRLINKRELEINGEYTKLGRELSIHEFKGYTVAKIDSIEKTLVRLEDDRKEETKQAREQHSEDMNLLREKCDTIETNVGVLQEFKTKVMTFAGLIGVFAGVVGSFLLNTWNNLPK